MREHFENIFLQSNRWDSVKSEIDLLKTKKDKGDCFELLTKYFFQIYPTYKTSLKSVWLRSETPTTIKDWINLPSEDEGIDLIAETYRGTVWAIQCKYHQDESHSVGRKELSTAIDLTFNVCRDIELLLVCTNAGRYSRKMKMYGDDISFCTGDIWQSLDENYFHSLHAHIKGREPSITPNTPRPHQETAISNAVQYFNEENNSRGKLIHPCGTGKSLTGYWITDACNARSVIVAVPSINLIRQTLEVWSQEAVANGKAFNWIVVCSDESVAKADTDDLSILTHDLGIKVHTNADDIAGWLVNGGQKDTVVFTTYQSGKAISEAARKAGLTFDLGIFDEAHKTTGRSDSLFSHLLFDENIAIDKRLFMTATERYYRGQSDQIASMDDYDIYGETFELLSFKNAIEAEKPILSDYKIVTIVVTKEEVQKLVSENVYVKPDKGKWDEVVEAEMLASAIALKKAVQKYPIRHAVSFHKTISRAKAYRDIQNNLNDAMSRFNKLDTFHVTGKTSSYDRNEELNRFASSDRGVITNARCLTEGVDIPNIDCVLFADPKRSTVDIIQAVGRALRLSDDKKHGYVVIPVLIDQDETDINTIKNSTYIAIITVLRALASNDERIIEYFRSIASGIKGDSESGNIEIDVPSGLKIDINAFIHDINLITWSKLAKLSWRPFEEARDFIHSLNLKLQSEWVKYCAGEYPELPIKPVDIPSNPRVVYMTKGWENYGDWLGTGNIALKDRIYLDFIDARKFVHKLRIDSVSEWKKYCKGKYPNLPPKPNDIPISAAKTYEKCGWISWGDWLGTDRIASRSIKYYSYEKSINFVHKLNLKSRSEWSKYCKGDYPDLPGKPEGIPIKPDNTYKNSGWRSMGDWLGTGTIATKHRVYLPYEEAKRFVHKLKLRRVEEWRTYCRDSKHFHPDLPSKPDNIPAKPDKVYRNNGWKGMGDWLGTGTIASFRRVYPSYHESKKFVHSLNLKNESEWRKYCKGEYYDLIPKPDDIPASPGRVYKNKGWKGMGDWLGTGTIAPNKRNYRSYEEAEDFVHNLNLKTQAEWKKYCKGELIDYSNKPDDIPTNPQRTYKSKGWKNWGNWLGTNK